MQEPVWPVCYPCKVPSICVVVYSIVASGRLFVWKVNVPLIHNTCSEPVFCLPVLLNSRLKSEFLELNPVWACSNVCVFFLKIFWNTYYTAHVRISRSPSSREYRFSIFSLSSSGRFRRSLVLYNFRYIFYTERKMQYVTILKIMFCL